MVPRYRSAVGVMKKLIINEYYIFQDYQEQGSVYYDYPYLPERQDYSEEHVHNHDHDHWSQPELNYLSNDYSNGLARQFL